MLNITKLLYAHQNMVILRTHSFSLVRSILFHVLSFGFVRSISFGRFRSVDFVRSISVGRFRSVDFVHDGR